MLGKSFAEAIRILVPAHAETAAINIGRDWFFDLPVERMAALLEGAATQDLLSPEAPEPVYSGDQIAARRSDLLDQVAAFFRNVEPSSPVPFLADRARELAQRDFLSLLDDVLPERVASDPR